MKVLNDFSVIHPSATVAANCAIGLFCVIGADVALGAGVTLGNHVTIYPGTRLGPGCTVGDNSVLGKMPSSAPTSTLKLTDLEPLQLGANCYIGSNVIIYAGTVVGDQGFVADSAQVRERCRLDQNVIVGRGVTVENDTSIGAYTKIQTSAYITAKSLIEESVFIAPGVTTTNDNFIGRTAERHGKIRGPVIRKGARVGGGAVLLPGVDIGQEAVVAAGAVVTHSVPPYKVVMGCPARVVRDTPAEQVIYLPEES